MSDNYSRERTRRVPPRVLEAVTSLLRGLRRSGIIIERVYLFGSYARGDYLENSDVDLIIVSSSFRGMRFLDRLDLVYRVEWKLDISPWIEVIPLTPEEFEEKKKHSIVVRDAMKYWIEIVPDNGETR